MVTILELNKTHYFVNSASSIANEIMRFPTCFVAEMLIVLQTTHKVLIVLRRLNFKCCAVGNQGLHLKEFFVIWADDGRYTINGCLWHIVDTCAKAAAAPA